MANAFRTGIVAIVGQPNVGKSTLLNAIVGQKVSIVSNKAQTTRRRILGIATTAAYQIVFIDTPGIHEPHTRLQKTMLEHSRAALADVDLILFVVDGSKHPSDDDREIARLIRLRSAPASAPEEAEEDLTPYPLSIGSAEEAGQPLQSPGHGQWRGGPGASTPSHGEGRGGPVILCLNKMDKLKAENVQSFVDSYTHLAGTDEYMLTTATQGRNVDKLVEMIVAHLPEGEPLYPEDEFTDQSSRFLVAELIREKILNATRQEVPHATAVLVEEWEDEPDITKIGASIYVEKASQRGILIGRQGQFLKQIGTDARKEIETLLDRRVFLRLDVKVREGWRMNPRLLQELEYSD